MKYLVILSFFACMLATAKAGEVDRISIITPLSYERRPVMGQSLAASSGVWVADLVGATDIAPKIKNSIAPYKNDLKAFFKTPADLDNLVDSLIEDAKKNVIGYRTDLFGNKKLNAIDDAKVIQVNKFFGNNLVGKIADKILEGEGVIDPLRRKLWVDKLLTPFNQCVDKAKNGLFAADHCMSALTSSLVPTAGIGIVYELSRSNLGPALPENQQSAFYEEQVALYKSCWNQSSAQASDVEKCALVAMRSGVQKVTDIKLSATINKSASSAPAAKNIRESIWPSFTKCSSSVGTNKSSSVALNTQFMNCIDDLVKNTGALLVEDKLSHTDAVKSNFNKKEMDLLINEKMQSFKNCIDDQKKNNVRENGMLSTSHCENEITNDITYKVVVKTFDKTAQSSFKSAPTAALKLSKEGRGLLDQCWKNDQGEPARESCLRKTILSFSQAVAKIKLDQAIPSDLPIKNALMTSSLEDLNKCLDKQLPQNVSQTADIGALTDICASKLTENVAIKVARESIKIKAKESKLSDGESQELIASHVDQKFSKCIANNTSDAQLDKCTGELKRNVAISLATKQIRTNAQGKISPQETEVLIQNLVGSKFGACIGNNPSDSVLNSCVADLTRSATKALVLGYEKNQLQEQLNAKKTPTKIKPVEDAFIACTDKPYPVEKVASELDECTKQFALGFAETLGELKLTTLLRSVLGSEGYKEQKKTIDDILGKYSQCLQSLRPVAMNDGLLEKLTVCTDDLQRRGVNFVSNAVNNWMSSDQKDAATIMVKNEFANFVPCLGALMPASPYSQKLEQNVQSTLKPVAMLLAQYIEYSPDDAKKTLGDVIKKLSTDLKDVSTNPASRKELIDLLYQNGAFDQFLKAMVRGKVQEAINQTPESELPGELRSSLLSKANFDAMFATPEGLAIKNLVMEKIAKPVLMDQESMDSPLMKAGMDAVQEKVTKLLVYSPRFGDQIIKSSIQSKIDNLGGLKTFFAKVLYGSDALKWEKVRTTPHGKEAEEFIRENVLLPKFKGTVLDKKEEEKIMKEAEKLVNTAVEKYDR